MIQALEAIRAYKKGNRVEAAGHPWLSWIISAEERTVNLERVRSLQELDGANPVLDYVERSLQLLENERVSFWIQELVEEVLSWSETAKGGTYRQRLEWQEQGIALLAHNEGSAQLYKLHMEQAHERNHAPESGRFTVIYTLIRTHGLIGQYLRGEVSFEENRPLTRLVELGLLSAQELKAVLMPLNRCIIGAVSMELWLDLLPEAERVIDRIVQGGPDEPFPLQERLKKLRAASISRGESFEEEYAKLACKPELINLLLKIENKTLWYVEAALHEFSFEQFTKLLLLVLTSPDSAQVRHISFERMMNSMYYDYKGIKKINVYKKRMIEKFLRDRSFEAVTANEVKPDMHLQPHLEREGPAGDTVYFNMQFSPAAEKLIDFCIEAEKSPLYEKAVLMLFDLFGLRHDAYDRFHNEEVYLTTMNQTADYKKIILDYIVGTKVLDIGPGGGVMLDLIEEQLPDKQPIGIDISQNVIEALERKRQTEHRKWRVMKGDALNLQHYFNPENVDTVIFSSILHELYSYIEFNGSKFNLDTVAAALRSAFEVLVPGGRIIIRDGIMSEPVEQQRIITFFDKTGMAWLERYANDFAGRTIRYEVTGPDEVRMPVNDAMEFLYTYTWGEEAYVHEVQEQFGYLTPSGYTRFIEAVLGSEARIIECRHFLQEGYTQALSSKIRLLNKRRENVDLPDSTCLIVIEKKPGK